MELPRIHRLGKKLKRPTGYRCTNCRSCFIEERRICNECQSVELQKVLFSGIGTLQSFTKVFSAPTGYEDLAPYYLGLIRLDDGPCLLAQLADVADDSVKIGMRLESVVRRLYADGSSGPILYGYKFRPFFRPVFPQAHE